MIRAVTLLSLVVSALGGKASCAVNGAAAASNALDASVYAWVASNRCVPQKPATTVTEQNKLECTYDVLSTISAITEMANTIAGAVTGCDTFKGDAECGTAVGSFLSAVTSLGANTAHATGNCMAHHKKDPKNWGTLSDDNTQTAIGQCVGDVAASLNGIFASAHSMKHVKEECSDEDGTCAQNVLDILNAVLSFGGGAGQAVNDCGGAHGAGIAPNAAYNTEAPGGNVMSQCAGDILNAFADITSIAQAAIDMKDSCESTTSRLYEQIHGKEATGAQSNALWATLLPLGALATFAGGFLGGLRWKNGKRTTRLVEAATCPEAGPLCDTREVSNALL